MCRACDGRAPSVPGRSPRRQRDGGRPGGIVAASLTLLAGLAACGAAPPPPAAPPPETGYLLLVPEGEGLRTEWRDGEGRLRGRADGAMLGVADRLYRFESRPERVALRPCEELRGGETNEDAGASGTVASAVLGGVGGASSLLLAASPGDGGLQDFAAHAMQHRLLAAHGRRVVLLTERAWSTCGAHGERRVTIDTFDLASGARRPPMHAPDVPGRSDEALEAMRAVDPNRTGLCLSEAGLAARWVTSVPRYVEGRVRARHLFAAAPIPYACGPLEGAPSSSYEWAIWIDGDVGELAGWGPEDEVPAAVLRRAAELGALGITWLDAARAPIADGFAVADE